MAGAEGRFNIRDMQHTTTAPATAPSYSLRLVSQSMIGSLERSEVSTPIPGAVWHVAHKEGDGLVYRFEPGALEQRGFSAPIFCWTAMSPPHSN